MATMTSGTATPTPASRTNPWSASLYAGLLTAIVALILVLLAGVPVVPALVGLLLGAAPVLAVQMATGGVGQWKPVIGGMIGFILFVAGLFVPGEAFGWVAPVLALLSMILWPILVGAMSARHSVGRLLLASLLGLVLAVVIFFVVASLMGQDPEGWVGTASIFALSFWGGTVGAALKAGAR